jgi:hypothetical protein
MPIRPFLKDDHSFGPEDIAKMCAAFESTLRKLGLADRSADRSTSCARHLLGEISCNVKLGSSLAEQKFQSWLVQR